jgi:prepilin-type N-terminal cleavage/methylation domain-containing protein
VSARSQAGFTLLEVMIALAILSLTLVVMLRIVTNNVRATNHAKMTTAATFLARGKMVDLETSVLINGFIDNNETAKGNFKAQNYPQFSWEAFIDRVELPTDLVQRSQDETKNTMNNAKDPMSMMSGFIGGMMGSFIEPIRIGLQESVRRVTVRVYWDEIGRSEQVVEVVQYMTDPAKLDLAMPGMAGAGAVPPGTTPGTGTGVGTGAFTPGMGGPGTGGGILGGGSMGFGGLPPIRP